MIKWTFGIITAGGKESREYITKILNSIYSQGIPIEDYEIIIVGGDPWEDHKKVIHIPFDESQKAGWITKKKNIIANEANFPNLCLMHDYVILKPGWYEGFEEFGMEWDCCMTKIANKDGLRFRDHVTWDCAKGQRPAPGTVRFIDYDDLSQIKNQYISGTYYCVKKDFAIKHPLNNKLTHGKSEDVDWAYRVRHFWNYKMNKNSTVQFLKQKPPHPISNEKVCEAI